MVSVGGLEGEHQKFYSILFYRLFSVNIQDELTITGHMNRLAKILQNAL